MSIKCYNYFENLSNEFFMSVKYNKNKLIVMTFENGSYNVSDINQIVDDTIQEKFNTFKHFLLKNELSLLC